MKAPSSKVRNTSRSKISWPAGVLMFVEMFAVVTGASWRLASVTVPPDARDTPVFTPYPSYPVTVKFVSKVNCSPCTVPVMAAGAAHGTMKEYGLASTYAVDDTPGDAQLTAVRVPAVDSGTPPEMVPPRVALRAG